MNRFLAPIRPTVRAVILSDGRLLVQLKQKPAGTPYLTLPGGKQEPGETMEASLRRECAEEIGANVQVGPLLHVAEVHKPKADGIRHQTEMLFSCSVPPGYVPCVGPLPDPSQIDTIWADPLTPQAPFRPDFARHILRPESPTYLGVFHG
ncbi:NUDIX domain-containing protein [Tropicimonas marinistellae]|uniref:NUDIX domain-containing protein n=1 Tax=Tropicimonas marinistellae TaxID=1739787 RepID=UPI001F3F63FA|nr:NUDIX domain-containing protein [Tropicimonas marinistellae]